MDHAPAQVEAENECGPLPDPGGIIWLDGAPAANIGAGPIEAPLHRLTFVRRSARITLPGLEVELASRGAPPCAALVPWALCRAFMRPDLLRLYWPDGRPLAIDGAAVLAVIPRRRSAPAAARLRRRALALALRERTLEFTEWSTDTRISRRLAAWIVAGLSVVVGALVAQALSMAWGTLPHSRAALIAFFAATGVVALVVVLYRMIAWRTLQSLARPAGLRARVDGLGIALALERGEERFAPWEAVRSVTRAWHDRRLVLTDGAELDVTHLPRTAEAAALFVGSR